MDDIPSDAPRPRLCHLKKWSDFNGYGFNLHAERGKAGQFVGTIDLGSPAEVAQLRAGDRIVEVNGTNIGSENHQQVVSRIKAVPNETRLLVVDNETDAYYRDLKIRVHSGMPNVELNETPDVNPFTHRGGATGIETSMTSMKVSAPDYDYDKHQARLCQLRTWPDFQGYGFNLHADRSKSGQFIGKVDPGSPAEASGLLEGDRIFEVNGVSVIEKSHAEVVNEVKARQGQVDLLVVDCEADDYFRSHDVTVHGGMPGLVTITCPHSNPQTANGGVVHDSSAVAVPEYSHHEEHDRYSPDHYEEEHHEVHAYMPQAHEVANTEEHTVESTHEERVVVGSNFHVSESDRPVSGGDRVQLNVRDVPDTAVEKTKHEVSTTSSDSHVKATTSTSITASSHPAASPTPSASSGKAVTVGGIEFAGSAKEARERMNKKRNVKTDPSLSLKDKYDILQKL